MTADNLDNMSDSMALSYFDWLTKKINNRKLTTSQRARRLDEETKSLYVRVFGYNDGTDIVDTLINNVHYQYFTTEPAKQIFERAKKLSLHSPQKAINYLKNNSSKYRKVLKEGLSDMEYALYKGYTPSIFSKVAPIRNWDITSLVSEDFLNEHFDNEVIILEYNNTPFRISNGVMTYYESDSSVARALVRELVEEEKCKKKNKIKVDVSYQDLVVKESR